MRYAILSDIHGNLEALTAVLTRLGSERIDRYVCLGDLVGYGADPAACLERLDACKAVMVAGNHDVACVGRLSLDWFNETARAAVEWTRDQLGFVELDRLRRLPLTAVDGPCTLAHGTLKHPERFEYLMDLAQAVDSLHACETLWCLVGHTHVPCLIEYERPARRVTRVLAQPSELEDVPYIDAPQRMRYLLNPGSVGQPRDGDPRASCAVLDTEACRVRVLRTPYNIPGAQRKIRDAGLPAFLADRLAVGR